MGNTMPPRDPDEDEEDEEEEDRADEPEPDSLINRRSCASRDEEKRAGAFRIGA